MVELLFAWLALQSSPRIDCREPITQMAINRCAAEAYRRADLEMNRLWKLAVADAKQSDKDRRPISSDTRPSYFSALLEGQRAWLKYRDAHCVSEGYSARGGSMEPMLVATCKERLTKERTTQLYELINGLGG
jgi:uncharacterized protein YecT (DUF1311 family)